MMRRTELKRSTSQLARNGFKAKQKVPDSAPKRLKAKRKPLTKIQKSAKGQPCTLRLPVCNFDPATTVWCHSNSYSDGKGMGLKARDEEGCYGCFACHAFLDGGYAGRMPRSLLDTYFDLARAESQQILKTMGLMP